MNKEQQTPKALETLAPMPELYSGVGDSLGNVLSSILLKKGALFVVVKEMSEADYETFEPGLRFPVGHATTANHPRPRYTGPIDDETLANILIYG